MVTANADDPYTLMIEPWGMTYELSGSEHIYFDLELSAEQCPELVAWPGGYSIFVAGRAVTETQLAESCTSSDTPGSAAVTRLAPASFAASEPE
jgi:hypothetical protein